MINKITIVSLSRGLLGEPKVKHELDIGLQRLNDYGLEVQFSKHALDGIETLYEHPEYRAKDLLDALHSDTDMILCAIGGDDTYRLLPYLFDNNELQQAACNKIFLGFSDTTMNHFMLHKVGMRTFYGQSFLPDICEIGKSILPYTAKYFEELIQTCCISRITPSDIWYESRQDFSPSAVGTPLKENKNRGFELLQGPAKFSGKILGGCLDSMFDLFNNERYSDTVDVCSKYSLFPTKEDWKGRILLLETSEEEPVPEKFRRMIQALKGTGIFDVINGVLLGKSVDEIYYEDYKKIIVEEIGNSDLPIVANVSVGHAQPRCIIPFGVMAHVDVKNQIVEFDNDNYSKA